MSPACERLEERWGMNHPMSTVFAALSSIEYRGGGNKKDIVPFPILRLGNSGKVSSALQYIRALGTS